MEVLVRGAQREMPSELIDEFRAVCQDNMTLDYEERSQDDVVKIVASCNKYKVPIVPYGGATSIEGHTLAPHRGACIDMSFMKVQGRKVTLLDLTGEEVGRGIVMSDEKKKSVMGMMLSGVFYEILVFLAIKLEAPLFEKDADKNIMGDAVGSHIAWLKEYIRIDLA